MIKPRPESALHVLGALPRSSMAQAESREGGLRLSTYVAIYRLLSTTQPLFAAAQHKWVK